MSDPADLTATEATRRIRSGRLSTAALLEACLDRIDAREGQVRAFAHFDAAQARRAKPVDGPLYGLPVGVKDVLDTSDMPSEYGSPIWAGHRPLADAACVAWTRAAGGVILGKTVTTEFATRKPGPTTNPANPAHTPGGSSSGSAAGVAAGFFPLAFGTQTAGSIIRPAAYCGVVGFKPSFGSIPRLGMKVMSDNLDTIGVMARSVADCALFAGTVANRDLGDPDARLDRAPHIGLCRSPAWDKAAPETQVLWERVTGAVARAGAALQERELPEAYRALDTAHPLVMNAESGRSMGWELLTARTQISDVLRERLEWGLAHPTAELDAALAVFARLQDGVPALMDGVDILLTPAAPGEAPAGLEWTGDPAFNAYWTALHVPCVTVPAGTGPNGLPLGIQIVGRRGDDRRTLAWAQWVAAAVAN
ncbi:amidase [Limobrevibacterium gyesilva]|uniref:Amidase n=1 Tax=Limobrevibacterium gyesilva TaxID=2991712 RepID=A0AA41YLS2_9PROT|nr:amidase [Limobrevibacterium gyesilva]MCW3475035.1 amidase [Limobrevibacterium gyesilva]